MTKIRHRGSILCYCGGESSKILNNITKWLAGNFVENRWREVINIKGEYDM